MSNKWTTLYNVAVREDRLREERRGAFIVICLLLGMVLFIGFMIKSEIRAYNTEDPCVRSILDYKVRIQRGVTTIRDIERFCKMHGESWKSHLEGSEGDKLP